MSSTQGSNAEVELAQLALQRGTTNEVLGYAGNMIAEHKGMSEMARKWMPTIQAHLELAVDVAKHVGGSSPFKQ